MNDSIIPPSLIFFKYILELLDHLLVGHAEFEDHAAGGVQVLIAEGIQHGVAFGAAVGGGELAHELLLAGADAVEAVGQHIGGHGKGALLGQAQIDATHVPDLVPALAVAAASLPQRTTVTGAARLRLKESDRLQSVADMLAALGHDATVTADGLVIDGGTPKPCRQAVRTVDGANDHRIVMAAAIAAAHSDRPVRIVGAQAVEKSYPDFFRDFEALGGKLYVERAGQSL